MGNAGSAVGRDVLDQIDPDPDADGASWQRKRRKRRGHKQKRAEARERMYSALLEPGVNARITRQLTALFDGADTNGDGFLDFDELAALVAHRAKLDVAATLVAHRARRFYQIACIIPSRNLGAAS